MVKALTLTNSLPPPFDGQVPRECGVSTGKTSGWWYGWGHTRWAPDPVINGGLTKINGRNEMGFTGEKMPCLKRGYVITCITGSGAHLVDVLFQFPKFLLNKSLGMRFFPACNLDDSEG